MSYRSRHNLYGHRKAQSRKRTWVYCQRPNVYGCAACECGREADQWSEFKGHLWCSQCCRDFIPEHNGVFDGPIPIEGARLMGIEFRRVNIRTGKAMKYPP